MQLGRPRDVRFFWHNPMRPIISLPTQRLASTRICHTKLKPCPLKPVPSPYVSYGFWQYAKRL
eukprot:9279722-Karenia_brevis.AAC.1